MDIKENSTENTSSFGDAFGTLRWKIRPVWSSQDWKTHGETKRA